MWQEHVDYKAQKHIMIEFIHVYILCFAFINRREHNTSGKRKKEEKGNNNNFATN